MEIRRLILAMVLCGIVAFIHAYNANLLQQDQAEKAKAALEASGGDVRPGDVNPGGQTPDPGGQTGNATDGNTTGANANGNTGTGDATQVPGK